MGKGKEVHLTGIQGKQKGLRGQKMEQVLYGKFWNVRMGMLGIR